MATLPLNTPVVLVLLFCLVAELAVWQLRRRRPSSRLVTWSSLFIWYVRPWLAASIVNIVFRLAKYGFSNCRTYPFYANPIWPHSSYSIWQNIARIPSFEGVWPWLPIASLIAMLFTLLAVFVSRLSARRPKLVHLCPIVFSLYATVVFFVIAIGSLPNGFYTGEGQRSSFIGYWHDPGSTMLYAIQYMRPTPKKYVQNFPAIQEERLGLTIHAKSHPPVASLFVRWIGALAGVDVADRNSYREAPVRLRYALGQTVVSALNAVIVFLIGACMFDRRTGLFAAMLWGVAPSVGNYASFAPDMNYALFFHGSLLFTWLIATAPSWKKSLFYAIPLGLCFTMLILMNFSWCIVTTDFAVFVAATGILSRRGWKDTALRAIPSLTAMTLFALWTFHHYKIDYLTIYRNSSRHVSGFYHHDTLFESFVTLVGGQVEWLFLLGPLVCAGFFIAIRHFRANRTHTEQVLFALVLLAVFAIPVLFGPACLKSEVARCWIWMAAVPIILSARFFLEKASAPQCAAVVFSSAATTMLMRLFVTLAG